MRRGSGRKVGLWALLCLASPWAGCRAEVALPAAVDLRPAVKVGRDEVSRYLAFKFYRRYCGALQAREKRNPSETETRRWWDTFVAQQVIISHLEAQGYERRPDVRAAVDTMERHMLGLLGAAAETAAPSFSDADWAGAYSALGIRVDFICAEFPDASIGNRLLGTDFDSLPLRDQTERIMGAEGREGTTLFEGARMWPYSPLVQISERIATAQAGPWLRISEPGDPTLYLLRLRNRYERDPGWTGPGREAFGKEWRYVAQATAALRRRRRLLHQAAFAVDLHLAQRLCDATAGHMTDHMQIPAAAIGPIADRALCAYNLSTHRQVVSVADFARYYNAQYLRSAIRNNTEVAELARDLAMEAFNVEIARARAFDRTPQFVQDRLGFRRAQMLAAYERESLLPALEISASGLGAEAARLYGMAADDATRRRLMAQPALESAERELARKLPEWSQIAVVLTVNDLIGTSPGSKTGANAFRENSANSLADRSIKTQTWRGK